jgi:hypothetical protein
MSDRRIFLSHAASDRSFVRAVAAALQARGLETWDAESTGVEGRVAEDLIAALRSASVLVAFLGQSPESPWLDFEIGAALGASKPVLPVFLTGFARESSPPPLRELSGIDASDLKPEEVADDIWKAVTASS